MNKKILYIFIIVSIMTVFNFSYIVFDLLSKKNNNTSKIQNNKSSIKSENTQQEYPAPINEADSDAALYNKANKVGDPSVCEQIENDSFKLICEVDTINTKARLEKNTKVCDEIANQSYRFNCYDNIIIFLAAKEKNIKKCDELNNLGRQEECQSAVK